VCPGRIVLSDQPLSTPELQAPCATCTDDLTNLDGNAIFVSHVPASSSAANGEFDDQLAWISVGELYGKLIAAGQLP